MIGETGHGPASTRSGYGGPLSPMPTDETASQIRDAVGQAEQYLSDIQEQINALERRLETVLTPAPPSGVTEANKRAQPGSHLLGRIAILNEGFATACQRLTYLRGRIEV